LVFMIFNKPIPIGFRGGILFETLSSVGAEATVA
jgi:hypothetical protein